jgi:hypothetical protein
VSDIIVKLRRNADSLNQAGHFAQAAATMREAGGEIVALRAAIRDGVTQTSRTQYQARWRT